MELALWLQVVTQGYLRATYSGGSICESGLFVHVNDRLQPQSYLHATYFGGSICESGLYVLILVKVSGKWLVSPRQSQGNFRKA